MLQFAARAGPAGPAFSFSAFLLPARPLACVDRAGFLSSRFAAVPDSSITGSHGLNRAGLGLWRCRFLTWLSKPHIRPHRAEFGFSPQNEFTPPPKGGGAGFCSSLGFRVLLGSCLWQPLATTGSHGPNRAGLLLQWRRSPTRLSKSHTGPHRGEFGFTAFSWCASFAAAQQTVVPGGNSPPPG